MDVRCEKCLTVYDFDESQVGAGGVTVKCTQCGNLFKVKRREATGETRLGAAVRASGTASANANAVNAANLATAPTLPPPGVVQSPSPPPPTAATSWAVRLASTGEIFRFREMTTLQQWIVERKVVRDDEISRDERTWKPLGGIPDLEPFFRTVAQAMSVDATPSLPVADFESGPMTPTAFAPTLPPPPKAAPPAPPPRVPVQPPPAVAAPLPPPPVVPPRPRREPTGPHSLGTPSAVIPSGQSGPVALGSKLPLPPVVDELASAPDDDELAPARQRPPKWMMIAIPVGVVVVAGALVLGLGGKKLFGGKGGDGARKSTALVDSGYEKLRSDGDDGFRQASDLFMQARAADGEDARALAGLAETKAAWAFYLREDARLLDAQGAPAQSIAQTLRKQAQAALDEGKRAATDALALAPDAPEVNRAMGDLLRVDGAPAAEVERYLKRSLDKSPSDPVATYVMGALLLREGKQDEAKSRLEQANTLEQAARKQPLLRANYLLAKIAAGAGKRDEAKQLVAAILGVNPQHERAKALSAQLESTPNAPTVATPTPSPTPTPPPPTTPAATPPAVTPPTATPSSTPSVSATESAAPGDYNKIVAQADRLLENGRTDQARKLYEKALAARPDGVEAVTGLGYCDLDRERFLGAVDHFKKALSISPEYGEALIGLAESYKVRGEKSQAVDYYRRYLKVQPNGPRAAMAQKNVRELEAKGSTPAAPATPPTEATPAPTPSPSHAAPAESEGAKGDDAPKALPRPPPSDQPPP